MTEEIQKKEKLYGVIAEVWAAAGLVDTPLR